MVIEEGDENTLLPISGRYYQTDIISSDFDNDVTPLITKETALQTGIEYYIPNGDTTSLFHNDEGKVELLIYHNQEYGNNIPFTLSYTVEYSYQDTESEDVLTAFVVVDAKSGSVIDGFTSMIGQQRDCTDLDEAWATGGNVKIGEIRQGPMCIDERPNVENNRVRVFDYISSSNQQLAQCQAGGGSAFCEVQDYQINGGYNCLGDGYEYGLVTFDLYDDWGPGDWGPLAPSQLPLRFYLHYGTNYENAFYTNGQMYFGDGQNIFYPLISLDVAAHEVAHGFTAQTSNLQYSQQSGGINEAYSDLAGEAAEAYARGEGNNDWLIGYDITKALPPNCARNSNANPNGLDGKCALRYPPNPPLDGNSIGKASDFVSNMNVHYSSGVYNLGFYRLNQFRGWTMQEVFHVISWANAEEWGRSTNYQEGLCGIIQAVNDCGLWATGPVISLRQNDVRVAFGPDSLGGVDGPDVGGPCSSSSNLKQGVIMDEGGDIKQEGEDEPSQGSTNDHEMYYIYGGIGAGCFAILAILLIVYLYKRRSNILKQQLNKALSGNNNDAVYGAIVTDDERE
eukprot:CAMPEP_0201567256 /NCGR_PEP_ID=MMETSP0190_2-20130828/7675_1 /ASSEMBLY_ACC=CAM_ASM_000263 /TAXON_ID=37353 /ORGANISM="Rosalina sp." /LENGTH=565 /DNA_ID=CAMNT_0047987025 /DNA_START=254 /DNA_END=1951 /DNA_ORIENTATION=+